MDQKRSTCPIPTSRTCIREGESKGKVKRSASILKECNVYKSYIADDSSDLFGDKLPIDSDNKIPGHHHIFGMEGVIESHASSKADQGGKVSRGIQNVLPSSSSGSNQ